MGVIDRDDSSGMGWSLQGGLDDDPTSHAVADQHGGRQGKRRMTWATSAPYRSIEPSAAVPGLAPCPRRSTATVRWRGERCVI
jgi:hypothetical protein